MKVAIFIVAVLAVAHVKAAAVATEDEISVLRKCQNNVARNCKSVTTDEGLITLDGSGSGSAPVCTFLAKDDLLQQTFSFTFTVQLYSRTDNGDSAHPGVAFNVEDSDNFDVVYFRPHETGTARCVQHGYVSDGQLTLTEESPCDGVTIAADVWFTVKLVSRGQMQEEFYVDDVLVSKIHGHFPVRGQAGVMVLNGYQNQVSFRGATMQ